MKTALTAAFGLALLAFVPGGSAAPGCYFSDNFNAENGGTGTLNYFGLSQWTVTGGSVDLIGTGFFDFYPGNGLYLDLDGSSGSGGTIQSSAISLAPGTYTISFDLGGSKRGDTNVVHVTFNGVTTDYTVLSADPLTVLSIPVTLAAPLTDSIVIKNDGGDNLGAILDNVSICGEPSIPTPELPAIVLVAIGAVAIGGIVIARRT